MNYFRYPFFFALMLCSSLLAQQAPTTDSATSTALREKQQLHASSLVKHFPFTNIGPTIMSGRVVDIDVNPDNPNEFYVAYASGGLWYTNNNGTSFEPVMDNAATLNIGDIAIDWKLGTIWVGTGESNSSRSSYPGIGVLKSTDRGATWQHMGLKDSHHIGRVVINKNNANEVLVGVLGHLYSPNATRGIYKTKDGGQTWEQVLFIDQQTGVVDISPSPTNPSILYAAAWERQRAAWNFDGDGKNSGIYKSEDGGDSWTKVSTKDSGFPTGEGVGRIGLASFNDQVIYALLDNQNRRPKSAKKDNGDLSKEDFKEMSVAAFLALDNKKLDQYLRSNGFRKSDTSKRVKAAVKAGDLKPVHLATYLEDANSQLFDTPVIGAEVYKSTDGGKTWKKTHTDYLNGVYNSYGYYFGIIAVNTANENQIYIGGVPLMSSSDGGQSFSSIGKANVHADHQALWVNPKLPGHVIDGNDGGINITYDNGKNWTKNNAISVGQFYTVNVDQNSPYNVYGGLQDNGVWYGPSTYQASKYWESSGQYPYKRIGGGDGMQVQIDTRDNSTVYSGYQFGYYYRVNLKTQKRHYFHPKHQLGDAPYRFNWQTPILLSSHNQDILYMGANKLLRSMDQGEHFTEISGDLTTGGKKGNVPYGTLTSISESPFAFGWIYTGSDDGLIHMTKDGGNTWTNITGNLPKDLWVSRVIASAHHKGRVYVTLNGMRFDHFDSYVYVSENNGKDWRSIGDRIPDSAVNVIKEDPKNEQVLYLGTDNGLYVSLDQGKSWHPFTKGFPEVAVHDLVIQEPSNDLVVATHGRSLYKTNIGLLQTALKNADLKLFSIAPVKHNNNWGRARNQWSKANTPQISIPVYSKTSKNVTVEIHHDKTVVARFDATLDKGYNFVPYDLSFSKKGLKAFQKLVPKTKVTAAKNKVNYLPKGSYQVVIASQKQPLHLK